jgi:hypothetical protein
MEATQLDTKLMLKLRDLKFKLNIEIKMMSGKRLEEVLSWLLIKVDFQPKIMNSLDLR